MVAIMLSVFKMYCRSIFPNIEERPLCLTMDVARLVQGIDLILVPGLGQAIYDILISGLGQEMYYILVLGLGQGVY